MRRLPILFAAGLILAISIGGPAFATEFRLKNIPEKYAKMSGAILEEDEQSVTIMTQDSVLIRSLDTIEIVDRTPVKDKEFIEKYGPSNQLYQDYLRRKQNLTSTPDSVSAPGETYLLRHQFTQGETQYQTANASINVQVKMGALNMPMDFTLDAILKLNTQKADSSGDASIKLEIDQLEINSQMANRKETIDLSKLPATARAQLENLVFETNTLGEIDMDPLKNLSMMSSPGMNANNFGAFFFTKLPKQKVAVGDSWQEQIEIPLPEQKEPAYAYSVSTLEDVLLINGEKVAVVSNQTSVNLKDIKIDPQAMGGGMAPMAGAAMEMKEMRMNTKVTAHLNLETKVQTSSSMTASIMMDMGEMGPQKQAMAFTMKMSGIMEHSKTKPNSFLEKKAPSVSSSSKSTAPKSDSSAPESTAGAGSTRSNYNRVKTELRQLENALESFFIDNNQYPVPLDDGRTIDKAGLKIGERVVKLNSPVSYISSFPIDPFDPEKKPYRYFSDGKTYILISNGPDGKEDFDERASKGAGVQAFIDKVFRPEKGFDSPGDIIQTGPRKKTQ